MEEDFLGNALYTLFGDSSIEADELGNLFVNFRDTSYYTTAAGTKGDWLLRQYGESIIVRDDNGIAYARAEDGDWYISSLPRVNADTNPMAAANSATGLEQAGVEADPLNQDLNYALADAKPISVNVNTNPMAAASSATGQEQAGVKADILNQDLNYALTDAKPASGNAALAKEFYERWQYNYEIRVGPANPATVRDWDYFDIGSATQEEVAQYYEVQDAKQNSLVDTVREMLPAKEAGKAETKNTEFNSDAIYWSYDLSPIPPSEVGGKIELSKSTVDGLKAAASVALDASGEFALDRGGDGKTITLPGGKVITSETLKTYGEAIKGIGILLDAKDAKEYGEKVFQEAKNRGLSDEDANSIAHRAVYNYLGWFKLPERGGQALLASRVPGGGYTGSVLGEFLESNSQDDIKDYFMNRAIKEYINDKENWQNFKAPDSSTYYNRTR